MNEWTVKDVDTGDVWHKDSRKEAEEAVEDFGDVRNLEIIGPGEDIEPEVVDQTEDTAADGGAVEAEVVGESEETETAPQPPEPEESDEIITGMEDLRENHPDLLTESVPLQDPLSTLPGWMITEVSYSDRGDTSTTVNKRGCQVIARALNIEVQTDDVTRASETDFEYSEFKAVAKRPDGQEFTGHGTARADGVDQDESAGWKLDMQAETRVYKRAVKNATGGGIEAFAKEGGQ